MTIHDATEVAYKNGYAAGKRDALKWIPVTERLPEEDGQYLVYTIRGSVLVNYFYAKKTFPDGFTRKASWRGRKCVTHWMPLPEPPKEDA